jgi:hypothetical protein
MASYDPAANHGPKISYAPVDVSLVKPVLRDYGASGPASTPPRQPAAKTEQRA